MKRKCLMMLCLSMMVVFSSSCADSGHTRPGEKGVTVPPTPAPSPTEEGTKGQKANVPADDAKGANAPEDGKEKEGNGDPAKVETTATKTAGDKNVGKGKEPDQPPTSATGEDKETKRATGSKEDSFLDLLSGPEGTSLNIKAQRKLRVTITNKDNHSFSWQVPGYYEGNKTFSYEKLRIVTTQKATDMPAFRSHFALLYGISEARIKVEGTDLLIADFDAEIFLKAILAMKYSTAIKDVVFGTVVPKVTPPGR